MSADPSKAEIEPFIGTRWFSLSDCGLFFGRDEEKDHISARLISSRPVFVHGPSGAGKTSMLYAGVIPAIVDQLNRFATNRPVVFIAARDWRSSDPLIDAGWGIVNPGQPLPRELKRLPEPCRTLEQAGRLVLTAAKDSISQDASPPLLLYILDQLEDLWPRPGDDIDHGKQLPAIRLDLARLVQVVKSGTGRKMAANERPSELLCFTLDEDVDIALVGGIRQDCLGLLNKLNEDVAINFDDLFELSLLSVESASEAIKLPLNAAGIEINNESLTRLVDDLGKLSIDQSLSKTRSNAEIKPDPSSNVSNPGASSIIRATNESAILIEPLLLQIIMERLYAKATTGTFATRKIEYDTRAGSEHISAIASNYFSECISKVDRRLHRVRDLCFSSLVSSQGRSIAKSAVEIHQDLVDRDEVTSQQDVQRVLSILADERILRPLSSRNTDGQSPTQRYELFHSLFAALARHRSEALIQKDREVSQKRRLHSKWLLGSALLFAVLGIAVAAIASWDVRKAKQEVKQAKQEVLTSNAEVFAAKARTKNLVEEANQKIEESKKRLSELQREAAPYAVFQILPSPDEYKDTKDNQRKLIDRHSSVKNFDLAAAAKERINALRFDTQTASRTGLFSVDVIRAGRPRGAKEYNCSFRLNFNSRQWPSRYGDLGESFSMMTWAWDTPGFLRPVIFSVNVKNNEVGNDWNFVAPTCHRDVYALIQPKNSQTTTTLFKVDLCALARQSVGKTNLECRLDGK